MSETTSQSTYCIESLTGAENYAMWKIKMRDILTRQDLWEHVAGMTSLPEDASRQAAWRK